MTVCPLIQAYLLGRPNICVCISIYKYLHIYIYTHTYDTNSSSGSQIRLNKTVKTYLFIWGPSSSWNEAISEPHWRSSSSDVSAVVNVGVSGCWFKFILQVVFLQGKCKKFKDDLNVNCWVRMDISQRPCSVLASVTICFFEYFMCISTYMYSHRQNGKTKNSATPWFLLRWNRVYGNTFFFLHNYLVFHNYVLFQKFCRHTVRIGKSLPNSIVLVWFVWCKCCLLKFTTKSSIILLRPCDPLRHPVGQGFFFS